MAEQGALSEQDIKDLFNHIACIKSRGCDFYILQVDTEVRLYYRYIGKNRSVTGRGGARLILLSNG